MNLPLFIAGRYLFARKSHNVINVISMISAAGMAVGTAALILILSVFNGFGGIIADNLSDLDPDAAVVPAKGKSFIADAGFMDGLVSDPNVSSVISTVSENVFVLYDGRQSLAKARGVDDDYLNVSGIQRHLIEGELELRFGELVQCCLGAELSRRLGAYPRFSDRLSVYFPDRDGSISISDPMSSLRCIEAFPESVVSIDAETDRSLLVLPIDSMRELLGYGDDEVSLLEIRLKDASPSALKALAARLPDGLELLDRTAQHPEIYRMMRYEKAAIFLILLFVVIIVAFNIFGSLSMLIIEKKDDIAVLRALGADNRTIRRVFVLEGWLVSLCGLAAGLLLGVGLALLQQHFGIIKMPGSYLVDAYPVILEFSDVMLVSATVALTGYLIALTARLRTSDPSREEL